MALNIQTFNNQTGGNAVYKALTHPLAARKGAELIARLKAQGPVALYDVVGLGANVALFHDLASLNIAGVYVQDVEAIGGTLLGHAAQPVTAMPSSGAATVLVLCYDAKRRIDHIAHLLPHGAEVVSLDALRLPEALLTDKRTYLNPLNFATNFAFFREQDGHHTRVVSADYWQAYSRGAGGQVWACLFDSAGAVLAEWTQPLPGANHTMVIDSAEVRARHGLSDFTGQLFLHVVGAAGHDIVKYALDTYGDTDTVLSCTHDANAWPANRYAGLPAPNADEAVYLWLQNSHPQPIQSGEIGLNRMGEADIAWLQETIPPYGTLRLDTASLLPGLGWPEQIEVQAGKHMVRPRYEVENTATGRLRMAHVNVEREDLRHDPKLAQYGHLLGKSFILPAPILPPSRFRSLALPTPMSSAQTNMPLKVLAYDAEGKLLAERELGVLPRNHALALDAADLLGDTPLTTGWGHMELIYDFSAGDEGVADGWLHALFRYEDRITGHAAETSFGAHMFNGVLTYRGEPQSYNGPAPGLSTRLFLRVGPGPWDTMCHLVYAASTPWKATSTTALVLTSADGREIAQKNVAIACGGSLLFRVRETFTAEELAEAGDHAYVLIRDTTCRLFGYHGCLRGQNDTAFSLDHMFGF
jgi:hypothetical protein